MDSKELNLDSLEKVTGGTSPLLPEQDGLPVSTADNDFGQPVNPVNVPGEGSFCKICGSPLARIAQLGVGVGDEGELVCTNPMCAAGRKRNISL